MDAQSLVLMAKDLDLTWPAQEYLHEITSLPAHLKGSPPHSCASCEIILLDLLPIAEAIEKTGRRVRRDPPGLASELDLGFPSRASKWRPGQRHVRDDFRRLWYAIPIDKTLLAAIQGDVVVAGAEQGCSFLASCFQRHLERREISKQDHSMAFRILIRNDSLIPNVWMQQRDLRTVEIFSSLSTGRHEDEGNHEAEMILAKFNITVNQGSSASLYCQNLALLPDANTPETFDLCREWLRNCKAYHHKLCDTRSTSFLPTYLLKIYHTQSQGIQLVEGKHINYKDPSAKPDYLALSYCWGGAISVQTTRANLSAHLVGIEINTLPPTLQDAIKVARELGISYFWVDCLCIVQDDDPKAKAAQIATMDQVYGQASVTVRAASAKSVEEGFLGSRPIEFTSGFQLHIRSPDASISRALLTDRRGSFPDEAYGSVPQHIDTRAWSLQEAVLSRRVLTFSRIGLFWECLCVGHAEHTSSNHYNTIVRSKIHSDFKSRAAAFSDGDIIAMYRFWPRTVMQYSRRKLSVPQDKLPALAGLAKRIFSLVKDEYVAGMWRGSLLRHLLWHVPSATDDASSYLRERVDPATPSWSWASVQGCVKWVDLELHEVAKFLIPSIVPVAGGDRYGRLRSGFLSITARIQAVRWANAQRSLICLPDRSVFLEARPDTMITNKDLNRHDTPLWCLELLRCNSVSTSKDFGATGLLLSSSVNGMYRRIGAYGQVMPLDERGDLYLQRERLGTLPPRDYEPDDALDRETFEEYRMGKPKATRKRWEMELREFYKGREIDWLVGAEVRNVTIV